MANGPRRHPPTAIYLSGPISIDPEGYVEKFKLVAAKYRAEGFDVFSPAEMDEASGGIEVHSYEDLMARDIMILLRNDVTRIYMLEGWDQSRGALLEKHIAETLGMEVYDAETGLLMTNSPSLEAYRLVNGDRGDNYGHPYYDFGRTAGMINAAMGHKLKEEITAEDVAIMMICVKISREMNRPKHDNRVDICGYAEALDMVVARRAQLNKDTS
jgi:hypothetical protein